MTVAPEIVFLKQGQGDFRLPTPPLPVAGPTLFEGVAETTWRLRLAARAQLWRHIDLDLDGGLHRISNEDHQPGVSASKFVGRFAVLYRFGGAVRLE